MKFNNKKTLIPNQSPIPTPIIMKVFAVQYAQIHNFGELLKKINWGSPPS